MNKIHKALMSPLKGVLTLDIDYLYYFIYRMNFPGLIASLIGFTAIIYDCAAHEMCGSVQPCFSRLCVR